MSLFLIQPRYLKLRAGQIPTSFPALVEATVVFGPDDAFGLPCEHRTTAPQATEGGSILWNANEGISWFQGPLIQKVEARTKIKEHIEGEFHGNVLSLRFPATSFENANRLLTSASHLLPSVMSHRLNTYVWIKSFEVAIADSRFGLETLGVRHHLTIATAEDNGAQLVASISDWCNFKDQHRRFLSALLYFRQAQRLAHIQPSPDSMVSEVILNLTKSLEILLGSTNRMQIRSRAKQWGFSEKEIEHFIIPLFLLRNELDVAHVASAPLTHEERETILDFTMTALWNTDNFLTRVRDSIMSEKIVLDPVSESLDKDKAKLLGAIKEYLGHNKQNLPN